MYLNRLFVAIALSSSVTSNIANADINKARSIIERKRESTGKYIARPVLSTRDTAQLLKGSRRMVPDAQERTLAAETIDNRIHDTPIRNQGAEGLCTAFAVSGALEFLGKKNARVFDLSEKHLWNMYQVYQTTNALAAARLNWVTNEASWPYAYARPVANPLPQQANLLDYREATTWDDVYSSIKNKRGVILSAVTNTSWSNPRGGVLSVQGQQQGGHAIAISGYFDTSRGRYLIIKNSWGNRYGDAGYVYMPEAYCSTYWCSFHIVTKAQVR